MAHSGVLYIFERQRGPKHRGAREKLSPFPLSTGLLMNTDMILEATASTLSWSLSLTRRSDFSIAGSDDPQPCVNYNDTQRTGLVA